MGACFGAVFTKKEFGIYICHDLIVQLKLTWIWYDLPTVAENIRNKCERFRKKWHRIENEVN